MFSQLIASASRNVRLAANAMQGTTQARALHRQHLAMPNSARAGIEEFDKRWPGIRRSEQAPVFILSAGWRSGSTLLQRLITSDNLLVWGEPYCHSAPVQTMSRQFRAFNDIWPHSEFFFDAHGTKSGDLADSWVANLYPSPQAFADAHVSFFETFFSMPAKAAGFSDWGLKEVRLTIDDACYLKWLFPNAKFLFLCRNPWDAWGSYRAWRRWYHDWPERPVLTATQFGKLWKKLAFDFSEFHRDVQGLLVRYEDLACEDTRSQLELYLGRPVQRSDELRRVDGRGGPGRKAAAYVPKLERILLSRQVGDLVPTFGYRDSRSNPE